MSHRSYRTSSSKTSLVDSLPWDGPTKTGSGDGRESRTPSLYSARSFDSTQSDSSGTSHQTCSSRKTVSSVETSITNFEATDSSIAPAQPELDASRFPLGNKLHVLLDAALFDDREDYITPDYLVEWTGADLAVRHCLACREAIKMTNTVSASDSAHAGRASDPRTKIFRNHAWESFWYISSSPNSEVERFQHDYTTQASTRAFCYRICVSRPFTERFAFPASLVGGSRTIP